jgi:predicted DNA binding protein
MLDVFLKVRPPSSWVRDIGERHDVPVVIFHCSPSGNEGGKSLVEIRSKSEKRLLEAADSMRVHPDLTDFHLINTSSGKMLGSVIAKNWIACSTILKSDCFLRQGKSLGNGWIEWEIYAINERALTGLIKEFELAGCEVSLVKKRKMKEPRTLSRKQESVVRTAFELGYYDFPRKITGAMLASKLGISPSTISEILQRAERNIVELYMRNHPETDL